MNSLEKHKAELEQTKTNLIRDLHKVDGALALLDMLIQERDKPKEPMQEKLD